MPRLKRLPRVPYGWYYVSLSSLDNRRLVTTRTDLANEMNVLRATIRGRGARLHAGYLAEREVHLVMQAGEGPISQVTADFQHGYARLANRDRGVEGSLFRPHHHVLLFQHQRWLVPLVNYVHWLRWLEESNTEPCDSWWSSDAAYRGGKKLDWLTTNVALRMLVRGAYSRESQREAYRMMSEHAPEPQHIRLFRKGLPEEPRLLGDAEFVRDVLRLVGLRSSIRVAREAESAQAMPTAVRHIVDEFNALCAEFLPQRKAIAFMKAVSYDTVCSKSRKHPLPMVRALSVSYLIKNKIATLAQAAHFFSCSPKSISARRRRYYDAQVDQLLGAGTARRLVASGYAHSV